VAITLGAEEQLITREIAGGRRLDEYLFERYFEPLAGDPPYPGARPPELVSLFRRRRRPPEGTLPPRELAHRLAEILYRLADADLFLPDLHPGNILVSGEAGNWRLSLVDLAEAEHPAPPEALLEHLLRLEHFFEPIASAAERLRCLARLGELVKARRPQSVGVVPSAGLVAHATAFYRRGFYRRRDRRTRRPSKYFARLAVDAWYGWATADWAETVAKLLAEMGTATAPPASRTAPLKEGRTSTVWRVRLDNGRALIVKRHNRAERSSLAQAILCLSRSIAAFRRGHALLARGLATARPAAAVDLRRGGAVVATLVFTEPVEDAMPLSDWLRTSPVPRLRRHVTWQLARMIQRLHDAGFSHRDLKAPNLLIAGAGGADPRPVLVDLDGLRAGRRPSARRRAQNLMRLSVSLDEWGVARRTDRLRFLRIYLGRRGCPAAITVRGRRRGSTKAAARLRRWWKRIARLSARKREALGLKAPATRPS
jgi:tRNA A-37 threonylcarbamoyl transferase component Bud32